MTIDEKEISEQDGDPERLFLFRMGGDRTWAYLQGSRSHEYNSQIYQPANIDMADITQALSEASPTIDIEMDGSLPVLREFVAYQPIFPMRVRVYRHHVTDADGEYKVELIGEVVSVQWDEDTGLANMSVRMVASNLDRKIPWPSYQGPCNYSLYGPGCRVNRDEYATETTALVMPNAEIVSADFATAASVNDDEQWFTAGYVVRVSTGESRFVIGQDEDTLFLQAPFVGMVSGEAVIAYAGCDRLKTTCEVKFNNLDRHMGFKFIPSKNPFVDNVYGTGAPASPGGSSTAQAASLNGTGNGGT